MSFVKYSKELKSIYEDLVKKQDSIKADIACLYLDLNKDCTNSTKDNSLVTLDQKQVVSEIKTCSLPLSFTLPGLNSLTIALTKSNINLIKPIFNLAHNEELRLIGTLGGKSAEASKQAIGVSNRAKSPEALIKDNTSQRFTIASRICVLEEQSALLYQAKYQNILEQIHIFAKNDLIPAFTKLHEDGEGFAIFNESDKLKKRLERDKNYLATLEQRDERYINSNSIYVRLALQLEAMACALTRIRLILERFSFYVGYYENKKDLDRVEAKSAAKEALESGADKAEVKDADRAEESQVEAADSKESSNIQGKEF